MKLTNDVTAYESPEIIHQTDTGWWFWDETWADEHGPFETREIAQEELERYCHAMGLGYKHLKIVFACDGGPNYEWAGCSFGDGIGGSEGCLIKLAEALAAQGHDVVVFNHCGSWSGVYEKVTYLDFSLYKDSRLPDTADWLISWRNWYLLLGRKAKVKWHSSHDVPDGCHHPHPSEMGREHDDALKTIDKIVYLNEHHRHRSLWWPDDRSFVCPIGIEQIPTDLDGHYTVALPKRDPLRVVTFYHPNRGLRVLRNLWARVRAEVRGATLQSYWWEPEHFMTPERDLGIMPMQRLDQRHILFECLKSGVMAYPSVFNPEICPASTLVAQAGGAYPVCIIKGGMINTVQHGYRTLDNNPDHFASTLISTLQRSGRGELEDERKAMMRWAQQLNWNNTADKWYHEAAKQVLRLK